MVIRTAGQSHYDGLIEGTPQGMGGVPITRKQVRAQRRAVMVVPLLDCRYWSTTNRTLITTPLPRRAYAWDRAQASARLCQDGECCSPCGSK